MVGWVIAKRICREGAHSCGGGGWVLVRLVGRMMQGRVPVCTNETRVEPRRGISGRTGHADEVWPVAGRAR